MSILLIAAIAVVAVVVVGILIFTSSWKVAEPNEALVISGFGSKGSEDGKGFRIVTGRGTVVFPGFQRARRLDLGAHRVSVDEACVTGQGIDVNISAVIIYKIGDDFASIANASRRFLGQEDQMDSQVHDVFAGHLRSIVGSMTMESLIQNRQELANNTRDASSSEVQKLGLIVDSLQIDKIGDPSGYIKNLGAPHVADVQSKARIAAAEANQLAVKREQETAAQNALVERDSQVQQAGAAADVEKAKATAAQAGPLAEAAAQQEVVRKQTELAELAAARTAKELESTVSKPADAEAYKNVTLAEAAKRTQILAAEADAEQVKLNGNAQAEAKRAVGEAEGAALTARREALARGGEAVIAQQLAEQFPEIVKQAASAYSNVGNMTVLNGTDGLNEGLVGLIAQASALFAPIRAIARSADTVEAPAVEKADEVIATKDSQKTLTESDNQ